MTRQEWIEDHADDACCCACGSRDVGSPHHRAAKSWFKRHGGNPDSPNNLCWMCRECHAQFHSIFGANLGAKAPASRPRRDALVADGVRLGARYAPAMPRWLRELVAERQGVPHV